MGTRQRDPLKFQGEAFLRIDFELDKSSGIRVVDVLASSMWSTEHLLTVCQGRFRVTGLPKN